MDKVNPAALPRLMAEAMGWENTSFIPGIPECYNYISPCGKYVVSLQGLGYLGREAFLPNTDRNHAEIWRDWVIEKVGFNAYFSKLNQRVGDTVYLSGNPMQRRLALLGLCSIATPAQESEAAWMAWQEYKE